jgi:hypothetical protein
MDETSDVALALKTGVPIKSKTRKEECIYCFTFQLRRSIKTDGVSGGPITPALI